MPPVSKKDLIARAASIEENPRDRMLLEMSLRERNAMLVQREISKHVKSAIQTLLDIMTDDAAPASARVAAARDVLDRAGGKAAQHVDDAVATNTNAAMLVTALRDLAKAANGHVNPRSGTVIDHDPR